MPEPTERLKLPDTEGEAIRRYQPLNFYELLPDDEKVLRERLQNNNGIAVGLIHPFYNNPLDHGIGKSNFPAERPLQEVMKQFSDFLKNAKLGGPPIFFFQGASTSQEAFAEAKKLLENAGSLVYVVPTYSDSAEPRGTNADLVESKRQLIIRLNDNFTELGNKLKGYGVTKMVLGGVKFGVHAEYDYYDNGCLNQAMTKLESFFRIKLSSFSWPSSRDTFKKYPSRREGYSKYL